MSSFRADILGLSFGDFVGIVLRYCREDPIGPEREVACEAKGFSDPLKEFPKENGSKKQVP